jgi:acetolactate synthase-1/2/3 large subunit
VWAIDGDGCFQMTNQELVTCAIEGIPIKVAVINNGNLGMVRQWQTLFYDSRYSNTRLQSKRIPDFVKLAEAMGCHGVRLADKTTLVDDLRAALALDGPVVVDARVTKEESVYPMIAPGQAARDMVG